MCFSDLSKQILKFSCAGKTFPIFLTWNGLCGGESHFCQISSCSKWAEIWKNIGANTMLYK